MATRPTCRTTTAWPGNAYYRFHSLTCRLIERGPWLDERCRIAPGHDPQNDVS